jgi:hypothetical protein
MMLKKFLFPCATALLVATGAATSWGQVVLGDFAGGSDDGWGPQGDATIASDNFYSTDGDPATNVATDGDGYALNIADAGGSAFWVLQLDHNDVPNLGAAILANPLLKADVSWVTDEWPDNTPGDNGDDWAQWHKVAVNSNLGWQEYGPDTGPVNELTDSANPGAPGSWDIHGFGRSHTRTLTWDLSAATIDTGGFVQLNMSTNFNGKWAPAGGSFWVDNIRLEPIPEPTGLTLAGAGGVLALVARRRRNV